MEDIVITNEEFGPLFKYINNEEIININYNGSVCLRDKRDKMQKINDPDVTDTWIKDFYNMLIKKYKMDCNIPFLQVFSKNLRIYCVSDLITAENRGCFVSIRKL